MKNLVDGEGEGGGPAFGEKKGGKGLSTATAESGEPNDQAAWVERLPNFGFSGQGEFVFEKNKTKQMLFFNVRRSGWEAKDVNGQ